jgi:hypothetical protein
MKTRCFLPAVGRSLTYSSWWSLPWHSWPLVVATVWLEFWALQLPRIKWVLDFWNCNYTIIIFLLLLAGW